MYVFSFVVENQPCSDCTTPISIRCVLISFQSNTMIVKISLINFHFRDISLWSSFCFSSWFLLMLACVVWSVCVWVFGKEENYFFFLKFAKTDALPLYPKNETYMWQNEKLHSFDLIFIVFSYVLIFHLYFLYFLRIFSKKNWWHQSETLAHTCRRVDAWKNKSF